jgi:hypothetical protein
MKPMKGCLNLESRRITGVGIIIESKGPISGMKLSMKETKPKNAARSIPIAMRSSQTEMP